MVFICQEDLPIPQSTQVRVKGTSQRFDPCHFSNLSRSDEILADETAMITTFRYGRTVEVQWEVLSIFGPRSLLLHFDHTMDFCAETDHFAREQNGMIHLQGRLE